MSNGGVALEQVRADLRPDVRPWEKGKRWAQKYTIEARKRARERHNRLAVRAQDLFIKHDIDKSGLLSRGQVKNLLTDLAGGTEPTGDELEFIMRMRITQRQDALTLKDTDVAIEAWECYQKEFAASSSAGYLSEVFDMYDTDKTGKLDFDQIKALLTDIEGGRTKRAPLVISDIDVEWMLTKADIVGDGQLNGKEFKLALCAWYQKIVRHDEEVLGVSGKQGGCACC